MVNKESGAALASARGKCQTKKGSTFGERLCDKEHMRQCRLRVMKVFISPRIRKALA